MSAAESVAVACVCGIRHVRSALPIERLSPRINYIKGVSRIYSVFPWMGTGLDIYAIERLTHRQVRQHIEKSPAVIVPLGGCEPFGGAGELGAGSVCAYAVAGELSKRCGVLTAPLIPFGCSTPYIAFSGAAGVKPRTFVNMLCEILHGYVFQGVARIILVSAAPFNREPAAEALRRLGVKYPGVKTAFFDINTVLPDDKDIDFDRDDGLLLSILSYIRQKCAGDNIVAKLVDKGQYKTWRRRGRDPQKFRAICPDGLILSPDAGITIDRGREYFDGIVNAISEKIKVL